MVVLLTLWAVSVYAQTGGVPDLMPAPEHPYDQMILVTTIIGFLTTITTLLLNTWKEARNRRWDLEDRRLARQDHDKKLDNQTDELRRIAQLESELTRARAAQVEAELKAEAARTAKALQTTQHVIVDKINENTEVSKSAFKEANDLNRKLEFMHAAIDGVRPKGSRRSTDPEPGQITAIQHTVEQTYDDIQHEAKPVIEETLDKVRRIEEATADGDSQHGRHHKGK